jgi:hypothetical protein
MLALEQTRHDTCERRSDGRNGGVQPRYPNSAIGEGAFNPPVPRRELVNRGQTAATN